MTRTRPAPWAAVAAFVALSAAGCAENRSETDTGSISSAPGNAGADATGSEIAPGTVYQRSVVFIDTSNEATMFVPWDFENRTEPDSIRHFLRGWLGRVGQWSQFVEDEWVTPATRTPWRILPRGAARMVVGFDDVLREIYFQEGIADLSVRPGEVVADWRGQRGDTWRLLEGAASLSGVEYQGLVVDAYVPRANGTGQASEWGLLIGDGPLYLLLADLEGMGTARAWALHGSEEMSWPTVTLTWGETRSFERARRDIPVQWRFRSSDGELVGEVESVSSHLRAIDGESPILPVLGVYEISGTVTVGGVRVDVKGFLRHFVP